MPLEDGDNNEEGPEAGLGDPELIRGGGTYILPRGIIRNDTFSFSYGLTQSMQQQQQHQQFKQQLLLLLLL